MPYGRPVPASLKEWSAELGGSGVFILLVVGGGFVFESYPRLVLPVLVTGLLLVAASIALALLVFALWVRRKLIIRGFPICPSCQGQNYKTAIRCKWCGPPILPRRF